MIYSILARIMSILKLSNTDIKLSADLIYPVGSIYMSLNDVNPSKLFGGTWEKIKDRFLLASGDTYNVGETGGSSTVTIDESNLPGSVTVRTNLTTGYGNTNWEQISGWGNYQNSSGGRITGQPMNNMPPYLAVCIWKRTA